MHVDRSIIPWGAECSPFAKNNFDPDDDDDDDDDDNDDNDDNDDITF